MSRATSDKDLVMLPAIEYARLTNRDLVHDPVPLADQDRTGPRLPG